MLAAIITVHTMILIVVVCVVGRVVIKHVVTEVLHAEQREIERRRQAGIQSGFTAGWHG